MAWQPSSGKGGSATRLLKSMEVNRCHHPSCVLTLLTAQLWKMTVLNQRTPHPHLPAVLRAHTRDHSLTGQPLALCLPGPLASVPSQPLGAARHPGPGADLCEKNLPVCCATCGF